MTEGIEAITAIHFVWMGALALLVLIAIVAGVRKQRRRSAARREVEAHAAEAGVEMAPVVPEERVAAPTPPSLPVAAPVPPADRPTPSAETDAAPSPADGPVTALKGLGPKVAARLGELGIDRVGQLAALDDRGAAELDAAMGPFQGRIARDRWIEQARLLAAGDREGFERVFGKL